ncbi:hypothetical protein IAE22_36730, partial [Bacillus sp. S34]|nr:hypothetical protein [Bacillus sp. S34]
LERQRNDVDFARGTFRVRGDTLEIIPMYEEHAIRIEMFGDEVVRERVRHGGEPLDDREAVAHLAHYRGDGG